MHIWGEDRNLKQLFDHDSISNLKIKKAGREMVGGGWGLGGQVLLLTVCEGALL